MESKSSLLGAIGAHFKASRRLASLALIIVSTSPCFAVSIQSPPNPASTTLPQTGSSLVADPPAISKIESEADAYQKLHYRYLFFYWLLAVGAGGPALIAAVKSFRPANATSSFDGWLLTLSLVTVISTTMLTTIQPNDLANRYRFGQILLDKALTRYHGIVGRSKTQADVDAVQAAYDTAEDVLIGGIPQAAKPLSDQHN